MIKYILIKVKSYIQTKKNKKKQNLIIKIIIFFKKIN